MIVNRALVISAIVVVLLLFGASNAEAEVTEAKVEYKANDARLVGYYYSDSSVKKDAPAILVFSDWLGVGDFAEERAKDLVKRGYRAFVADIYGDEKSVKDSAEAELLSNRFKSDRPLTRERAKAAFYALQKQTGVDVNRIGAIGFCFGGMVALELARSGVPVGATVSFHGTLNTPNTTMAKNITGRVLVLHGANDPFVSVEEVRVFEQEMRDANVNWEITKYGNAVHAFTNSAIGTDPFGGAAYNERVSKRAYAAMNEYFHDAFGQ